MSVMTSFTARSLKKNRMRTVVSIVGIALSCALLTAVFTSVISLQGGLLRSTLETEGSWQIFSPDVSTKTLDAFEQSDKVTDMVVTKELGSAKLNRKDSEMLGELVSVRTLPKAVKGSAEPGGIDITMLPKLEEGRMPQTANEVILPVYSKGEKLGVGDQSAGVTSSEELALGSTLTLDLGTRVVDDGGSARVLNSAHDTYRSPDEGGYPTEEYLVDTRSQTYTVVGFYQRQSPFLGSFTAAPSLLVAVTGADAPGEGLAGVYLAVQGFASLESMQTFVGEISDGNDAAASYHTSVFRYQGIVDDRPIWDTLWSLASVLAFVIVVASVSLIYNSFAISVADRTRQFGLLSSIGASKKQLRRSVLTEAMFLGLIGIPVGIVLGIAGVASVFALTQDAFASMLGSEQGLVLAIDPLVLAGVAALSLATLLVSAWIPARRAGKVSAIDSIRQTQDVRVSARAAKKARLAGEKATAKSSSKVTVGALAATTSETAVKTTAKRKGATVLRTGVAGKLFGAPGFVAQRNLSRSSARGRTVVASLAVSVALIVIAGSVATYLSPLSDRASSQNSAGSGADIIVSAGTPELSLLNELAPALEDFRRQAEAIEGIEFLSTYKQGQAEGIIPAAMISQDGRTIREDYDQMMNEAWAPSSFSEGGDYLGDVTIFYIDDASWLALAQSQGVDGSPAMDPSQPCAIALNRVQGTLSDGSYTDAKPFATTGTIDLYAINYASSWDSQKWSSLGVQEGENGGVVVGYINQEAAAVELIEKPLEEVASKVSVEIIALASQEPASINSGSAASRFPVLIMPESVAMRAGAGFAAPEVVGAIGSVDEGVAFLDGVDVTEGGFAKVSSASSGIRGLYDYWWASLSFTATDYATAEEALGALALNYENIAFNIYNVAESAEQNRLLSQAVQLFIFCFSAIMMLIAVANVFNTLTNSIILRTREFAVLKSVGMGDRAFARMLIYECASYAVRGLAIGLVLALAATFLLYQAASMSFMGLALDVAWVYVGIAVVVVLVILAASVIFALKKSHASSVVDALRTDAV